MSLLWRRTHCWSSSYTAVATLQLCSLRPNSCPWTNTIQEIKAYSLSSPFSKLRTTGLPQSVTGDQLRFPTLAPPSSLPVAWSRVSFKRGPTRWCDHMPATVQWSKWSRHKLCLRTSSGHWPPKMPPETSSRALAAASVLGWTQGKNREMLTKTESWS